MNERYYICDKKHKDLIYGYLDYHELKGFTFTPQNKVPYDGIKVSELVLVKPKLIKNVLKKKTKKKLNEYFAYLLSVLDDDDDDDTHISLMIDDVEKYKKLIINKYSKFLDKAYIQSLLKKVNVLEKGFKDKLNELIMNQKQTYGRRR